MPELERIRLDADAVAKPGALRDALERFARRGAAVLIGTQMVAKGHHFAGVALAAVVDADTGLALPDFRADERTFQLVTQLAGRSGRDAPGRVLVQTFQPDATPIAYAARHDVAGFLAGELERRASSATRRTGTSSRSSPRGRTPAAPERLLQELRGGLGERGGGAARPGAAAPPAWPSPRAAAREDRHARGRWRRAPPRFSPPPRRRCGGPASPPSSTSTRSRSERPRTLC